MQLSLGFSPCPNDTFIFDAMVNGKVDTEGLIFNYQMEDVETLNLRAFNNELDITKLSFHAFSYLTQTYTLLDSGSALGWNCGPLLISKQNFELGSIHEKKIGIPGKYTTANFLFMSEFANVKIVESMPFNEIEDQLLTGSIDAGVIIHENRFTYKEKGLYKLLDLGHAWQKKTGHPIPLGGIAIKKNIPNVIANKVNRIVKRSVQFAMQNTASSEGFVAANAQELDLKVINDHIGLYVNEYTVSLGKSGLDAIKYMLSIAKEMRLIKGYKNQFFISN